MRRFNVSIGNNSFLADSIKVFVPKIKEPVGIRLRTNDASPFIQVFINKTYEFPVPINIFPKLIIDCGAHVGYASIWFANLFPNSHIISVEPEESNYRFFD
jgi:hypothetical protein